MTAPQDDVDVLARLLESRVDLHALDLGGFRGWLAQRIAEQQDSDVFRQKCRIRDIVRRHQPRLARRAMAVDLARRAYETCPAFGEIERSARRLHRLRKGVEGIESALAEGRAAPAKLAEWKALYAQEQRARDELSATCPEKQRLDRAETALARLRTVIGLAHEEEVLGQLQRARGRRADTSGRKFEEIARKTIDEDIIPRLGVAVPLVALRGVVLGCARGEFDHLVVAAPPEQPVEVFALVEVKRNPNDIVSGFVQRQENLAWLTGDASRYDPELYRTRAFPTGHFDRPAVHRQDGREYQFDRNSFRRFRRDPASDCVLEGLHFVSAPRPLHGTTMSQLSRILHWAATEADFDLERDESLRRFRRRVLALVPPFQTANVLELYRQQSRDGQIHWRSDFRSSEGLSDAQGRAAADS